MPSPNSARTDRRTRGGCSALLRIATNFSRRFCDRRTRRFTPSSSLEDAVAEFGKDGPTYARWVQRFVENRDEFFAEILRSPHAPLHPFLLARGCRRRIRQGRTDVRAVGAALC